MISWIKKLFSFLKPANSKPVPGQVVTNPKPTTPPPKPIVVQDPPKPVPPQEDKLIEWTGRAIDITQAFEGNTPWANITGNFDGAGLTCGALGWTVKWHNQQPLVRKFVDKYGIKELTRLMPQTWEWYWYLTNIVSEDSAIKEANKISGLSQNVKQPHKKELEAFWQSAEMVQIQKEAAAKSMGTWAMGRSRDLAKYLGLSTPKFMHFAYFFDQAVLNGQGKDPTFGEAEVISVSSVFNWMDSESGYLQQDFDKNLNLWKGFTMAKPGPTEDQLLLFRHAKLRADRAREEFDTVVMCRRGIIIFGRGYVNGSYWNILEKL